MKATLEQLRVIPGVGKVVAGDLFDLGIRSLKQLGECHPEQMYLEHCELVQQLNPIRSCYNGGIERIARSTK